MPLDRAYSDRFEGYFNEKRSPAPKFGTSARNTLLAPNLFGGGYGTEPNAPHNIVTTAVGPRKIETPRPHTPCAVFGSSRRNDLWASSPPVSASYVHEGRSITPPASRTLSHSNNVSRDNTVAGSPPGPQSYKPPVSEFETTKVTQMEQRLMTAKFLREGVHTPRAYVAGGSKGGAISRSARKTVFSTISSPAPGPTAYRPKYGLV